MSVAHWKDGFFMILNVDKKDRVQKMTKFETAARQAESNHETQVTSTLLGCA